MSNITSEDLRCRSPYFKQEQPDENRLHVPITVKPTPRGVPPHVAFAAFCVAFFVFILFLHNHNSMAYVHNTIVYSLEPPAGWLRSTSRTTVRAFTIKSAAGGAVTRAALTATTTTTTVARTVGDADSSSGSTREHKGSRHPHPKHRILPDTWAPSSADAASQTPAKAPLPESERDIELQPQRVAKVVDQLSQQQNDAQEPITVAEKYADLYGASGAGSILLQPGADLSSCPAHTAAPQSATAVLLLADSSSGTAVLKRSLDGLMLLYSQSNADIRAAFHLYISLDGDDADMQQTAQQYALDSLGALKLVQQQTNSSSSGGSRTTGSKVPLISDSSSSSSSSDGNSRSQTSRVAASHVHLMLHVFFQCLQYPSVVLLEDDWKLLPDFLEYFDATRWLLGSDPTLSCISAWNPLAHSPQHSTQQQQQRSHKDMGRLQRVGTNPGRGWLLGRATGLQLLKTWPEGQKGQSSDLDWQQHVHSMGLRYGHQCVVPEVSRMVPAELHDTAEAAYIVPAVQQGTGGQEAGVIEGQPMAASREDSTTNSRTGSQTGSGMSSSADGNAGSSTAGDAGAHDHDAEHGPEVHWTPAADTPAAAAAAGAGPTGQGSSSAGQQGADEAQESAWSAWMGHDVSYVLSASYRPWLHQHLLSARAINASTAAQLTDSSSAVLVSYGTAAELTAAAEALGVPLVIETGVQYCYSLPFTTPARHCQDYLPDMAYEGVVTAHNKHGVRVYLVHLAYITALQGTSTQPDSQAVQATAAADTAVSRRV